MAAISWPTGLVVVPTDFSPGMQDIGEVIQINRHGFEHVIPGVQLRTASMSFDIRDELTSHRIMGMIENLEGARGTIKVPWFDYTTKIGSGTGSPTVSGAVNAGSSTIPTTGWTGSDPKLGQDAMVSFGNPPFVYRVLADGHRRVADVDRAAATHGSTSTPAPRSPTRPIRRTGSGWSRPCACGTPATSTAR